jgi:hypothetical protein
VTTPTPADAFIQRWSASTAHERAVYQHFFVELCDLLDVPRPDPAVREVFGFEKLVVIPHGDGRETPRWIDFYKRGAFVLEAKQGSDAGDATIGTARRGTPGWAAAMRRAWAQALNYALHLPDDRPPFLITCDIGHVFEVWTGFAGHYGDYGARRTVPFAELANPATREWLRTIFLDPWSLDPSRHAARVTGEVAIRLAALARTLEKQDRDPGLVAGFLMRCIFTMFAEDVGLVPKGLFRDALRQHWIPHPETFTEGIGGLWEAMDEGQRFGVAGKLLRFNGGLFASREALPLNPAQLGLLLEAAERDWSSVEPSIFGTLVERALDPVERERLGAHFTPRAYIERLVRRAVIDPLREDWTVAQAEARQAIDRVDDEPDEVKRRAAKREAIDAVRRFHARLCKTRFLDPACGTGNFLYVTFDLVKQVEAEVFRELEDLGERQGTLAMGTVTVNPSQFLGIERNTRAREIADLVLWIGYLKWFRQAHGDVQPPEPVLRAYGNIVCADAVLAWDERRPRADAQGRAITAWDMRTYKAHPVTRELVPDEAARVPVYDYIGTRPATWPDADFVVSNPPFVGNKPMRAALGDGYAEALRAAYPEVAGTVDLVMFWWEKAAKLVQAGTLRRFGFITTNSITQVFNRSVLARAIAGGVRLAWAIPDHPWVQVGAQVRIAMTVGEAATATGPAMLGRVTREGEDRGEDAQARDVEAEFRWVERIHADLKAGADVTSAKALAANGWLATTGVQLTGQGFVLDDAERAALSEATRRDLVRPYMIGRAITQPMARAYVLDTFGLSEETLRTRYPDAYQRLDGTVRGERYAKKNEKIKETWWLAERPRPDFRRALVGLSRYIATCRTATHRTFTFLPVDVVPETTVTAIPIDDAAFLGFLSGRPHLLWAHTAGGRLGVGNDPRYEHDRTFLPFPFPDPPAKLRARVAALAESLDAHRRAVQAAHPDAFLTAQYNALQRLRAASCAGAPLSEAERAFHDRALIGVLRSLHDDLDVAVAEAYGWPADLPDDVLIGRLVTLNAARAAEEAAGRVQWLRPDFQGPKAAGATQTALAIPESTATIEAGVLAWPSALGEQLTALRGALAARTGGLTAEEVARLFKNARRDVVRRHLQTLEELGVLVGFDDLSPTRPAPIRKWGLRAVAA